MPGLCAVGVILAHYLPWLLLFVARGVDGPLTWGRGAALGASLMLTPVLAPITIPLLPVALALTQDWVHLSAGEWTVVSVVFVLITLYMPAAFVQVSLSGMFRSAFRMRRAFSSSAHAVGSMRGREDLPCGDGPGDHHRSVVPVADLLVVPRDRVCIQ